MEYHQNGHSGGGDGGRTSSEFNQSPSNSSHSVSLSNNHFNSRHNHNDNMMMNEQDPMQCWWESVSKARSRIQTLLSLLPNHSDSLSSLADSDRPARSLLDSHAAYSSLSSSLSGSGDDPLCQWLYDTFLLDDPDLRLVVLSFVPLLSGLYLTGVHAASTTSPSTGSPSLAGFEAVLLALYSAETKSRGGKPLLVSVPSPAYLVHNASLYHAVNNSSSSSSRSPEMSSVCQVGVMCPPLEPQVGIKSTKRGIIMGVAFHCFYTHISHMPAWSKIDLCRFAASWAGDHFPCTVSFDDDIDPLSSPQFNVSEITLMPNTIHQQPMRIPLPWEMLQPMLRILAHCLLAPPPLVSDDIKEAASLAVARLYARASHDLTPQAILATRSLVQLHQRACAIAKAAAIAAASSLPATPTSAHKKTPEVLLVSK